jgi:uncharacterized membrane protein
MIPDELKRELDTLSRRLSRVERQLGLPPLPAQAAARDGVIAPPAAPLPTYVAPAAPPTTPPKVGPAERPPEEPQRVTPREGEAPAEPLILEPVRLTPKPTPLPAEAKAGSSAAPAGMLGKPPFGARETMGAAPMAPAKPRGSLELQIGMRWTAWVGAIVVVLAVGFFVKLAIDQGWFGHLSPMAKCLMAAGFGALLIAAGELALRKINRVAAVGMFGAGLGTLYLTALATYKQYELFSQVGAFWLMAVVAALGVMITVRGRLLSIGVLSLVGGYLSPFLLDKAASFPAALPLYATALLAVALVLSGALEKPFRPLRYVALAGQGVLASWWILSDGNAHWVLALALMGVSWAMVVAEAVLAARREQSPIGNAVGVLGATAWFVTAGCWVLSGVKPGERDWLGLFTAGVAWLAAAIAWLSGPGVEGLRKTAQTAIEKLAVTLWAQVGVLLAVAIAFQFHGFGMTIGWLALALASIELGRRLPSQGVTIFGLIVGGLAALRVVAVDHQVDDLQAVVWEYHGVTLTQWAILALAAVLATHAAARRITMRARDFDAGLPVLLGGAGTVGWLALCRVQCTGLPITGAWLLGSMVLLALERFSRRQRYLEIGLLALMATAGHWLVADTVLTRFNAGWDAAAVRPFLNWQMGLALAIAAVGWWGFHVALARSKTAAADASRLAASALHWQWVLVATAVFLLVALTFQIDVTVAHLAAARQTLGHRVGQLLNLLITLVWALGGLAVGLLGVVVWPRTERPGGAAPSVVFGFGWGVLVLCAAKWVLVDCLLLGVTGGPIGTPDVWPLLNVQMLVGVVTTAALLVLAALTGGLRAAGAREGLTRAVAWIPVAATVLVLWGLSFEVERAIGRFEARGGTSPWPGLQLRLLWLTLLWAAGGLAMTLYGRLRPWRTMLVTGWCVLISTALAWLTFDTIAWRISEGVVLATPVANLQFAVGALAAAMLAAGIVATRRGTGEIGCDPFAGPAVAVALAAITACGLWLGSLEIDRVCEREAGWLADADMARQTALSVYWGVYGIMLVSVGFARRAAWVRYTGLALLAATLLKVLIVDMAKVQYLYRVLSLLAVGLLCMATSVAYAKLASRLLGKSGDQRPIRGASDAANPTGGVT